MLIRGRVLPSTERSTQHSFLALRYSSPGTLAGAWAAWAAGSPLAAWAAEDCSATVGATETWAGWVGSSSPAGRCGVRAVIIHRMRLAPRANPTQTNQAELAFIQAELRPWADSDWPRKMDTGSEDSVLGSGGSGLSIAGGGTLTTGRSLEARPESRQASSTAFSSPSQARVTARTKARRWA